MLGQDEIINTLKSYKLETFPHSILFVGEKGSGKHTLVKEISSHFNLEVEDITDCLTYDKISDIQMRSIPKSYLIYMSDISEREQNILLKFLEEPSSNNYIMLVADTKMGILNTILNRCVEYSLKPYTKEMLSMFIESDDKSLLEYCNTPGQVLSSNSNIGQVVSLVNVMISKLKTSRFDNALSIVNKFNYKDEYDKYDIDTFFNVMISKSYTEYVNTDNKDAFLLYNIVNKYNSIRRDSRINKEILMENMITNMWRKLRNEL